MTALKTVSVASGSASLPVNFRRRLLDYQFATGRQSDEWQNSKIIFLVKLDALF
jgi:hypothetical protein